MRGAYLLAFLALAGCEWEREGTQVLPQVFLASETRLLAMDMVEIRVTVARPRPGALAAYSDCVGAQYALIRGLNYARRVAAIPMLTRQGMADVVSERTTYLLTDFPSSGSAPNAAKIVADCQANDIPTV